jgi:FdrA protein
VPVRALVHAAVYRDSVALLRLAEALRARTGVQDAAALMGTPANRELLRAAGLATSATEAARPGDLVLAVRAASADDADAALRAAEGLLAAAAPAAPEGRRARPRTLRTALAAHPDATLVAVSVPGAFAAAEARRALRAGRHVFLFSDHVPLADEVALKRLAAARGLLCMGPDCGTAYVAGVGLGFANVVPRGRVGVVAASGTGLQAVAAHLAALGDGLSHGLGVGGRDGSAEVAGLATRLALEALGRDPGTALVVLVTKPPDPAVLPALEAALGALGKPAVAWAPGVPPRAAGTVRWVATLEDAAGCASAVLGGRAWGPAPFADPAAVRAALDRVTAEPGRRGPGLLGLYTGGTLAHEARGLLEPELGPLGATLDGGDAGGGHRIVDLGADEHTVGRPHPMLDPEARARHVRAAGADPAVGVCLLDLVLGRGAHPDPAGPLAAAVREARATAAAAGRALAVVASVVGTAADPQGLPGQTAALRAAGAEVLPSNAQAARFAALCLRPARAPALLDARGADRIAAPGAPPGAGGPGSSARPVAAGADEPPEDPRAALLAAPPLVINVGLELFAETLRAAGVPVVSVDWRPPAGGDPALAALLARMEDDDA